MAQVCATTPLSCLSTCHPPTRAIPPLPPFCVDLREAWVDMSLSLIMPEDIGFALLAVSFCACPGTATPALALQCTAFL